MSTTVADERVVLLGAGGEPIGTMDKSLVHTTNTPLHLAFSCYAFDSDGRMLLTRRSLAKRTWPGVWTNTCCGHPAPGEKIDDAIRRRLRFELGVEVDSLRLVLPGFRYRAVAPDGIVENEVCPVYFAHLQSDPAPAPDEVMDWQWTSVTEFLTAAETVPFVLSPWSVLQANELRDAGELGTASESTYPSLQPNLGHRHDGRRPPLTKERGIIEP